MKPGLDLREYDALMFDAVQIVPTPESRISELPAELQQRAKDGLRQIMLETIEPYYDVVDEAEEHVLRIELAITDLVAER